MHSRASHFCLKRGPGASISENEFSQYQPFGYMFYVIFWQSLIFRIYVFKR